MKDYYEILRVHPSVSEDEIKEAYRRLAHKYHPDMDGGDATKFKEVHEAYEVLSNPYKRGVYDTEIKLARVPRETPPPQRYQEPARRVVVVEKKGLPAWGWVLIIIIILVILALNS